MEERFSCGRHKKEREVAEKRRAAQKKNDRRGRNLKLSDVKKEHTSGKKRKRN